ncbi:MAG: hypothetical protein WKF86_01305, partial [Acidimicrobiales bacterium]
MKGRSHRRTPLVLAAAVSVACLVLNAPASGQEGAEKATADLLRIAFPQEDGSLTPYTFEVGYPLLTLVDDTLMWRDAQGIPQPLLARA